MRWMWLLSLVACGGEGDGDGATTAGCDACSEDQVCVSNFGGDAEGDACAPIPADCGGVATCDSPCISALYDLCEDPYFGVGCSDTVAPVIVSCNL